MRWQSFRHPRSPSTATSDWTARTSSARSGTGLDVERDAWLVEVDGRVAGVAHLLEQKGGRYFGDAYVHPELTGRGVGTRLLDVTRGAGARAPSRVAGR